MLCSCIGNLTSLSRLRHLNLRWIRPLEFDCQWFRQWADMRTLQLDYVEDIRNSAALINQPGLRLTRLSVRSCKGITDQVIQPPLRATKSGCKHLGPVAAGRHQLSIGLE